MIILEPLGGLANRMRVIASGIWLSTKLNTRLEVIWNKNFEIGCAFNTLFEKKPAFIISNKKKKYNYIRSSHQATPINKLKAVIYNKLVNIDYCIQEQDFPALIWPGKLDVFEAAKNHKHVYIQTCQEFGDNLSAYQYFTPVPKILEVIQQTTKKFASRTVGVHIRRTDNLPAIKHSPISLFIEAMATELDSHKGTIFFLCSDDLGVKNKMIEIFGDKIITGKNEVNRNTIDGMQDAVADLYCLSKTNKMLGSYYSSFSEVAASLNNVELKVLKTE